MIFDLARGSVAARRIRIAVRLIRHEAQPYFRALRHRRSSLPSFGARTILPTMISGVTQACRNDTAYRFHNGCSYTSLLAICGHFFPASTASTPSAAIVATLEAASRVRLAICGVIIKFSSLNSGLSGSKGSLARTSAAAQCIWPAFKSLGKSALVHYFPAGAVDQDRPASSASIRARRSWPEVFRSAAHAATPRQRSQVIDLIRVRRCSRALRRYRHL